MFAVRASGAARGQGCLFLMVGKTPHESLSNAPAPQTRLAASLALLRAILEGTKRRPIVSSLVAIIGFTFALSTVVGLLLVFGKREDSTPIVTIRQALNRLDAQDYEEARRLAAQVFARGTKQDANIGGALYVLGAALQHDAATQGDESERRNAYLIASRYLEEAHQRGFPEGRRESGLYLLATSLFHSGRYAQSLPILRITVTEAAEHRTEMRRLLAEAYFRDSNPQWKQALAATQDYLATEDLTAEQRQDGLLRQCQIQFQLDDFDGCRETIQGIPANAETRAEIIVIQGRLLMHEADAALADTFSPNAEDAAQRLADAMRLFRQAKANEQVGNEATRQAQYLLGVCLRRRQDYAEAELQFARTCATFLHTPEGVAAGLEEAEMQRQLGKDEAALEAYVRVLQEAGAPDTYSNPWISLDDFRHRVEAGHAAFLAAQEFPLAIELARRMPPLLPESRGVQLRGDAHRAWADHLQKQTERLPSAEAKAVAARSREQYRHAGKAFAKLARLRVAAREHPNDIWQSTECFLLGRDFERAVREIQRYLEVEPRLRRSRALVALGEAHLSLGQLDPALKSLQECLEFHDRDPESYRARLLASYIFTERGQLLAAQAMLLANVDSDTLTPRSVEWRDSLFALGKLRLREAGEIGNAVPASDAPSAAVARLTQLEEAHAAHQVVARLLTQAIDRYPDAPQTVEAKYRLAVTQRQLTRWPRANLATTVFETSRRDLLRQIEAELQSAASGFGELRKTLNAKRENTELSEVEATVLRNCYFARADALFELGRYEQAIEEYSLAVNRFQNQPAALEALVQVATCYRRLNQPDDARGTLMQAKFILNRLDTDAAFASTTRCGREQWDELLTWMIAL